MVSTRVCGTQAPSFSGSVDFELPELECGCGLPSFDVGEGLQGTN